MATNNAAPLVLDELQWKSPEWIQYFQGLNSNNVLEYFMESPFFQESNKTEISNNQLIKMQSLEGVDNSNVTDEEVLATNGTTPNVDRTYILSNLPYHIELHKTLLKFKKGVEFILLAVNEPNNWIIRQQKKETVIAGQQKVVVQYTVLNEFFIIGSNVYMAPKLGDIINNRLLSCNYYLNESLKKIRDMSNGFTIKQGFSFNKETLQQHQNRKKKNLQLEQNLKNGNNDNKFETTESNNLDNENKVAEDSLLVDKLLAK
ncbi:hypothetical protein HANVADRAFT_28170 [Hanseniaspora valbyensis NRRL Y-1626]|uniref:Mediator of RNA polymerase II transcription subunit 6 n=1 Tax=Hanseniaspora valbyensis NRRL Y-1626 TaxID=766949 RepID=A0A1B7T7H4_9ASCO|nr:hypothetical protein HANVADRAFT_28170 [Hanseniaspora valbyensis NRRL Y-1626]